MFQMYRENRGEHFLGLKMTGDVCLMQLNLHENSYVQISILDAS